MVDGFWRENGGGDCTPRWRFCARATASQSDAFCPAPADAERIQWSHRCGRRGGQTTACRRWTDGASGNHGWGRCAGLRDRGADPTTVVSRDDGMAATPPIAEASAGIIRGRFSVAAEPAERGWTGGDPVSKRHWSGDAIGRGWSRLLSHHERSDGAVCRRAQPWGVTRSAMGSGKIRPAKSAMGPATGTPVRTDLRNDYCANQS